MKHELTLTVDLDEIINELPTNGLSWEEEEEYGDMSDTSVSAVALVYVDAKDYYRYNIDIEDIVCDLCQNVRRMFGGAIAESEKWMTSCKAVVMAWDESGDITAALSDEQYLAEEYRAESLADNERLNHE